MPDRDNNVVSLTNRLKKAKQQADDQQLAKQVDFQPSAQDIHTFMMVMRHLQKKSSNQTLKMELGAEFFSINLIESSASELTNMDMFFDIEQKARVITFDFPWHILDIDKSELRKDDNANDAVDLLNGCIQRWFNDIKIKH